MRTPTGQIKIKSGSLSRNSATPHPLTTPIPHPHSPSPPTLTPHPHSAPPHFLPLFLPMLWKSMDKPRKEPSSSTLLSSKTRAVSAMGSREQRQIPALTWRVAALQHTTTEETAPVQLLGIDAGCVQFCCKCQFLREKGTLTMDRRSVWALEM